MTPDVALGSAAMSSYIDSFCYASLLWMIPVPMQFYQAKLYSAGQGPPVGLLLLVNVDQSIHCHMLRIAAALLVNSTITAIQTIPWRPPTAHTWRLPQYFSWSAAD